MDKKLKKQSIQDLNYTIKSAKLHQKKASLFIKNNGMNAYLWGEN